VKYAIEQTSKDKSLTQKIAKLPTIAVGQHASKAGKKYRYELINPQSNTGKSGSVSLQKQMHRQKKPNSTIKNPLPEFYHDGIDRVPFIFFEVQKSIAKNIDEVTN